jgi:DNA-directed RNA polymerase specialized sigma24 family protein
VEFHDPEEFATAMLALTSVEKVRLRKAQQIYARPPLVEGSDLLHEMYARVFERSRRWRIGEDVLGFAIGVMRSLADEATKKGRREQVTASPGSRHSGEPVVTELGMANRAGVVGDVHRSVTPEDNLIAADEGRLIAAYRQGALEALADDEAALLLFEGMLDGMKGRELQVLTGLDDTAFASKQKLVKRRLEKLGRDAEAQRRSA